MLLGQIEVRLVDQFRHNTSPNPSNLSMLAFLLTYPPVS